MTTTQPTTRPLWITVCNGDVFEGHQGHWSNCFFSNAHRREIEAFLEGPHLRSSWEEDKEASASGPFIYEIREMTDEELAKFPEALEFQKWLMEEYGEC